MYAIRRLIDRCEDGEAASLRKKCGDFCRGLYDNTVAAAGESASHTSSYLLAAMVDLHADKLEIEGGKMTAGERDEELEKAKKVRHICCLLYAPATIEGHSPIFSYSFVRPWPPRST